MRKLTTTLLLACVSAAAYAQSDDPRRCSIADRLPREAEVYHVGTYAGTSSLGAQIELDNDGHEVRKTDVLVNLPNRSIVLVMTAYDPVVWNVAWTKGTRIVGAVVSGYHGQAVLGISKAVPLYRTTYTDTERREDGGALTPCPYFYVYKQDETAERASAVIRSITGKPVTRFIQAPRRGIVLVGGSLPAPGTTFESSADYRLKDFVVLRKRGELPAGERGMEELVKLGHARHATPEDIQRFEASGTKPIMRGVAAYVLLKQVDLPDGLYGGHSVSILIPEHVAMPGGPRGHSWFYKFGRPGCEGPAC
jgi:hypothetical protein